MISSSARAGWTGTATSRAATVYRGHFSTPKGNRSRRVDMSRELREALAELREERMLAGFQQGKASITDDLVFPGENGNPISPWDYR